MTERDVGHHARPPSFLIPAHVSDITLGIPHSSSLIPELPCVNNVTFFSNNVMDSEGAAYTFVLLKHLKQLIKKNTWEICFISLP